MICLSAAYYRRVNKSKILLWLVLVLGIVFLITNFDSIGRVFYPFPYRETTLNYARKYDVDPYLLAAIMKCESNFNRNAVSVRGARGLMQVMPETGKWVARQLGETDFHPDQLFEPETNIKYGSWYIADLKKEFHGDPVLVLAAYNGGRGNVKEWLFSNGLTGSQRTIDQIPFPETRQYVKKVLINQRIYRYLYR